MCVVRYKSERFILKKKDAHMQKYIYASQDIDN